MTRRERSQPLGIPLHVVGHGCGSLPVLGTDADRGHFVYLLDAVVRECGWTVFDWVLMSNHHHLVIELAEPNLSDGMKRLHGLHAMAWNARHSARGHAWQGRFWSCEIDEWSYCRSVMRYLDLNPVRGGLVRSPEEWRWSGYGANAGLAKRQPFHNVIAGRAMVVGGEDLTHDEICSRYRRWVTTDLERTRARAQAGVEFDRPRLDEILDDRRPDAIHRAIAVWGYTVGEIADALGVHRRTVLRWRAGGSVEQRR
jgi:REP element-mobilizing transposase RayT